MTHHRLALAWLGVSLSLLLGCREEERAQQPAPPPSVAAPEEPLAEQAEDVEVLARGPIHEAFAQPVTLADEADLTVSSRPPVAIEEIPPEEKPEGDHVVWIPGYWSWDDDRDDFIWVSGCWRAVPPERSWVPGYWAEVAGGYQWISGFWTTADSEEVEYLPMPPETLEAGPPVAITAADTVWVPGCWVWHEARYAWRPGFPQRVRPYWVWVPAHYIRSPYGWIYVEGYWDYVLERRGVVFLPVYCRPRPPGGAHLRFSPRITLNLSLVLEELFSSPRRHHYYFGDYYAADYVRRGFHPWYESRERHDWYDPIYVQQHWSHRDDAGWERNLRTEYEHRRDDEAARPPRTYEAARTQVSRLPEKERRDAQVGRPLREVVAEKTTPFKFEKLDKKGREETASRGRDLQAYEEQRARWEAPSGTRRPVLERTLPQPPEEATSRPPQEPRVTPPVRRPAAAVSPQEQPATEAPPREPAPRPARGRVTLPAQPRPAPVVTPEATPPAEEPEPSRAPAPRPTRGRVTPPAEPQPAPTVGPEEPPSGEEIQPHRVTIPKSPITVRKAVRDKQLTPPPKPEQPKPDTTVRPKPRRGSPAPEAPQAPPTAPKEGEQPVGGPS